MYDLDNTSVENVPEFKGITDPTAKYILESGFRDIYFKGAKSHGLPLVSIMAFSNNPDPSQLHLTRFERQVNQVKDNNGKATSASTLDYLCAVDGHDRPGASGSGFTWKWVQPNDINNMSGVIAINRSTIGKIFKDELLQQARKFFRKQQIKIESWTLKYRMHVDFNYANNADTAKVTDSGADVIKISYTGSDAQDSHEGGMYKYLKISHNYTSDVKFSGTTVTVTQRLWVFMHIKVQRTVREGNAYDKTTTDTYTLQVSQNGELLLTDKSETTAGAVTIDEVNGFEDAFTDINKQIRNVKGNINDVTQSSLTANPFQGLPNFIFPGGKVFAYKSASFSDYQDLVCDITYVSP